ncbi:MAG: DNA polymerase III subunit gamma/tau [Endomicrobium sp.]|jgi:DNA polymerase-3 subunit gamma/tau|nr:DNA polymerase III subunit gamma/tau [Endomicrobium sp.]
MSYLVLARKFRPKNFDEVIGQDHISQTLKNAITENRVAHAYLFSGPRGCGKTTMARILAKALNCKEGPTPHPCGVCENCVEIAKSSSVDVFEIDAASNTGVDNIRELRDNAKFVPSNSKYKVYIIDEVHQLSKGAFNALLKTLEEPPEHVIFVLATTEQHMVPVTVLSRCQKYRFKLISSKDIFNAIKSMGIKENFEIDDEALNIIITASGGSMRDALSLLDQAVSSCPEKITGQYIRGLLGLLPKDIIASVTQDLSKGDIQNILETVKNVFEQGYNILQFARDLRDHLRRVMIYSLNPEIADISTEEKKLFESQKSLFSVSRHVRMNNLLSKAIEEMRWHDQPRILLEMYLLKMSEPYYNVGELINKISELEKRVQDDAHRGRPSFSAGTSLEKNISEDLSGISAGDLLNIWTEIVSEITAKHLTASELKKAVAKVLGHNSVQLSVPDKYHYDGVMEFREQISKLYQRKTGSAVEVKVIIENIDQSAAAQEDIVVEEETALQPAQEYTVAEDLKESSKNAVPESVRKIAEGFGGSVKKID